MFRPPAPVTLSESWATLRGAAESVVAARANDPLRQLALVAAIDAVRAVVLEKELPAPVPMLLWCPKCGQRHVDKGAFAKKVHHTHACQNCGLAWQPAIVPTVGVDFLPGFKDEAP